MRLSPDVDQAVRQLYRRFPEYSDIRDLEDFSCPHCKLGEQIRPLLVDRTTVRPEHLVFYSMNALTTCGRVEHFKHFLPRLLETSDALCPGGPPLEWIGNGLRYAEWRSWPQIEVEAITATLVAILDEAISRPLGLAVPDCYELLDQGEWVDWLSAVEGGALVSIVALQGEKFLFSGRPQRYLDDIRLLNGRLGAGHLKQLLEDAFFDRDGHEAQVLSNVHLLLDRHDLL